MRRTYIILILIVVLFVLHNYSIHEKHKLLVGGVLDAQSPPKTRGRTSFAPVNGSLGDKTSADDSLSSDQLVKRALVAWRLAYDDLEARSDPGHPDPLLAWSASDASPIACHRYRHRYPCKSDPFCSWKSGKCSSTGSSERANRKPRSDDGLQKRKKQENKKKKNKRREGTHENVSAINSQREQPTIDDVKFQTTQKSSASDSSTEPAPLTCTDPCLSSLPPDSGSCSDGLLAKRQKDGQFERTGDAGAGEGGWRPLSAESYITWSFGGLERPAQSGWSRASVRIRGMEPGQWAAAKGTKHHVFAMHSRAGGPKSAAAIGSERERSLPSYWAVKVGREYVSNGNVAGLKFVWAFGGSKSRREFRLPAWDWLADRPALNGSTDQRFAVQWNASHISFYLDTDVSSSSRSGGGGGDVWQKPPVVRDAAFGPRSEELAHVWVGRDPDTPGFAGPLYSDLNVELSRPHPNAVETAGGSLSAALARDQSGARLLQLAPDKLVARLRKADSASSTTNDQVATTSQLSAVIADKHQILDEIEGEIEFLEQQV